MEYIVSLDEEAYYIKTAGDVLQTKWLALHRADPAHSFPYNTAQAAFSAWIDLPSLVHGKELGATVAGWKEHALADHNEALTCALSSKMLHAYAEMQACFHRLYLDKRHGETLCTWRNGSGALCPRKRRWDTAFCKEHAWLSAPPACLVALAKADDYCDELLRWMQNYRGEPRDWKRGHWADLRQLDGDCDGNIMLVAFLKEAKPWFVG
jgi:hypothetical protein